MGVVEIPQVQTVEKVVEVPEVQTVAGATRSVNLPSAPVRQTAPAEVVQVTEVGPLAGTHGSRRLRRWFNWWLWRCNLRGGRSGQRLRWRLGRCGGHYQFGRRLWRRGHDHGCTSDRCTHGSRRLRRWFNWWLRRCNLRGGRCGSTNDDGGRGSSRDHDHGCTSDHGSTHGDRGARSTFGDDIRRAAHLLVNGTSAGDQHEGVRCFEAFSLQSMTRRKQRVGLRRSVLDLTTQYLCPGA